MFRDTEQETNLLTDWDVSAAVTMESMFDGASNFRGNYSAWDVSGVRNMRNMFRRTAFYDKDVSVWDISGWDTSR